MVQECNYTKNKDVCPFQMKRCQDVCVLYDKIEKACTINVIAKYSRMACILLGAIAGVETVCNDLPSSIPDCTDQLPNESDEDYEMRKRIRGIE